MSNQISLGDAATGEDLELTGQETARSGSHVGTATKHPVDPNGPVKPNEPVPASPN
jgi:hypothetical protein